MKKLSKLAENIAVVFMTVLAFTMMIAVCWIFCK